MALIMWSSRGKKNHRSETGEIFITYQSSSLEEK